MITISDKTKCSGCEACVQACPKSCIYFEEDEYGFRYPRVNLEYCVNCGVCEKVCPVINVGDTHQPQRKVASKNNNEGQRSKSSSGGVFVLLAEETIRKGGVVFGARFDADWNVVHSCAETIEGVQPFLGSKYVQSRIGDSYRIAKEYLDEGRNVLFSGTSCQIAGLKQYLRKDYEKLLTVETMCHGVPSPKVWRGYLEYIRRPETAGTGGNAVLLSLTETPSIKGISFRDKHDGWGKFGFVVHYSVNQRETEKFGLSSVIAQNKSIEIREPHKENVFMQAFLSNAILRPICFACPFKSGKSRADISLGDFWTVDQYIPGINDDKGITLVYLLSQKGIEAYNALDVSTYEMENGIEYNVSFSKSTKVKYPIDKFWLLYNKQGFKCVSKVNEALRPSLFKRAKVSLNNSISNILNKIGLK